jgi:hypothetical protein
MLRRAVLAMLTLVAVLAAACGRQVTPNPPTSNLSGRMVITFGVQGTMDFTDYNYAIILNTCGSGGEPYPQAYQPGFGPYSYVFVVGASYGGLTAEPTLFQYLLATGSTQALNPHNVPVGSGTVSFLYPYNGQTSQFQLNFLRSQLNNPLQTSNPCPFVSPSPTPTPSPSPTPSATPAPGSTPTPSPAPSPTPTTQANATIWYINFFTLDRSGNVLDSLGINGPTDTSYSLPINVTQAVQEPVVRPAGSYTAGNPAVAISGGEVDNYLATPTPGP